ncbi:MAG: hypothetical protein R3E18_06260 [Sphingomonadaceae bacterium]
MADSSVQANLLITGICREKYGVLHGSAQSWRERRWFRWVPLRWLVLVALYLTAGRCWRGICPMRKKAADYELPA